MVEGTRVSVAGRELTLTNLDKVLYPESGFSKAQVVDYYARVAPIMVPHVVDRPLTFRRWPDGVEAQPFYEKNCPSHAPEWVRVAEGPGEVRSCVIDEEATLVWAANQAALEIHAPMSRAGALETPTHLVFDLDPGSPADVVTCGQVAMLVREVLETVGVECWVKTSGSKGLQISVPLNTPHDYDHTSSFALAVGQLLERQHPDLALTEMTRAKRKGRVFVDWSQNSFHKTTIAVYSLRGRDRPTVSTPVGWDELAAAVSAGDPTLLVFEAADVLDRVEELGDLWEDSLGLQQRLPRK